MGKDISITNRNLPVPKSSGTYKASGEKLSRSEMTKKALLRAGLKLFAQYGYDSTSTRMIAQEAGVNLSAISFHFSGKEQLYVACLDKIARMAAHFYDDTFTRCEDLLKSGSITKTQAYRAILELVSLQIKSASEHIYTSSLKLIYWEQVNSLSNYNRISSVIFERVEKVIAELIAAVTDKSLHESIIASRFLNGSIISFGEHKLLLSYLLDTDLPEDKDLPIWIQNEMSRVCDMFVRTILDM